MAPRKDYTTEQMAKAIEEVRKGEKISVAATRYGVPRITLHNKITGKSPVDYNLGPATVLSHEEENILVRWVCFMAEKHFPVTKEQLLDIVQKIISEKNLDSCPFTNNRPGKKWYSLFLKRHPDLSERTAHNLSKAREEVTEDDILRWFDVIKSYLENKGLLEVINDPERIFNSDESAFYLQPKAGRVLVRKGEKMRRERKFNCVGYWERCWSFSSTNDTLRNIATDTIRNGFRKSGLLPFGPEYVDMNKISSHNRATVSTSALEKKFDTTKQFMNILESEIRSLFTNEKLKLFTRLYYMPRDNVEGQLPNEDLSLYIIWAKTKDYLNENLPVSYKSRILQSLNMYFGPSTSQVCTDTNASDSGNPDLQEEDIGRPESVLKLSKTVSKDIAQQAMRTTPNKVFTPKTNDTIAQSLSSSSQNIIEENIEPVTESTKTISKDIACSAIYSTPNKVQNSELNNTISKPMPSKPQNVMDENILSPFKRALFWPEPEMKKSRSKERLPSAITEENDIPYQESDQDLELSEDDQINCPKHTTESLE
ncbi:hypothetical protein HW555_006095 [Spodoptera exigua]|uniref:HTH CENPB-type domain-containing protein n=1 Tax=Spodoptera exigua TaxID=7107 RepID=A0A835GJU9_SPOEX|nr:hypothetical protein HW555_006095 [Spodoptera exigua]